MNNYIEEALKEANKSLKNNDVPVGAIIVKDGVIIAKAHNSRYKSSITNHAEIIAINKAIKKTGDWRLNNCELYVTMEPCPMCAGAILQSRIGKVYIGCESNIKSNRNIISNIFNNNEYCHNVNVEYLNNLECSRIISDFFKLKR